MRKRFVVSLSLLMIIVGGPRTIADVRVNCKDGPAAGHTKADNPSHFHFTVSVGGTTVAAGSESLAEGETCETVLTNIRALICPPLTCTAVAAGPPGQNHFTVTHTPQGDPTGGSVCTDDENLGDSLGLFSVAEYVEVRVGLVGVSVADGDSITVDVDVSGGTISTTVDTTGKTGAEIRQDLLNAMEANDLAVSWGSPGPGCGDLPDELPAIVVSGDTSDNPPETVEFFSTDPSVKAGLSINAVSAIPTVSEWGLIVMTLLLLTAGAAVLGRRRREAIDD